MGRKGGEELDAVYENADIGPGCFGLYKRNINLSSVLKVRVSGEGPAGL